MKQFKNGVLYDTDTARLIGVSKEVFKGLYPQQSLYINKSFHYFIHLFDAVSIRDEIKAIDYEQAVLFARRYLDESVAVKEFEKLERSDSLVAINTVIPQSCKNKIVFLCSTREQKMQDVLTDIIEKY